MPTNTKSNMEYKRMSYLKCNTKYAFIENKYLVGLTIPFVFFKDSSINYNIDKSVMRL